MFTYILSNRWTKISFSNSSVAASWAAVGKMVAVVAPTAPVGVVDTVVDLDRVPVVGHLAVVARTFDIPFLPTSYML